MSNIVRPSCVSSDEVEQAAEVLFRAFEHHPIMTAVSGSSDALKEIMRSRVSSAALAGSLWLARDLSGEEDLGGIVGTLVCVIPGSEFGRTTSGYHRQEMDPELKRWQDEVFYPWFTSFQDAAFGPTGIADSLYLSLLAVEPTSQRRGLGRALVEAALGEADRLGVPSTLVTQERDKIRWYQSLGFEVAKHDEQDVRGEKIPWWAMKRG
ncbi:hypothetical protein EHS25_000753 [Saitozyma podzolica]|uniref:N-acetyltransferase domain-containing protein n=1 Tax=Saitozyma podzolica TaxID=1890683 RepID=A0A427YX53_9TREE|nr:hypothetical protein EHS25_000753 [Saitozyma podzolica]